MAKDGELDECKARLVVSAVVGGSDVVEPLVASVPIIPVLHDMAEVGSK